jgi:hypothetical protein
MKVTVFILLFCILATPIYAQKRLGPSKLSIAVNYNVELLGLAYFIGFEGVDIEKQTVEINGRTIPKKEWHTYGFYTYEKYKQYTASENLAKSFAIANHLWLDSILYLLIQVDDFPHARLANTIDTKYFIHFSKKNDTAEARQNAMIFLDGLNSFSKEINFEQYIRDTKLFYDAALREVKKSLPKSNFISAMETFYKKTFDNYILAPSLTIPKGMGFGLNFTKRGNTRLFNVFGAFEAQSFQQINTLNLGFANPQRLRELSIHEFGHSFVNPIIDSLPQEQIAATERLFEPIKAVMEQQGYNTWRVCLYEHFVRAGEVVIANLLGDTVGAQMLQTHYINDRKFIYLPSIINKLEIYQKKKQPYYKAALQAMDNLLEQK